MKFVNPRNDVAFKKIFGNEEHKEILISFLNAVLDLTGEKEIQEIELLNPYQAPRIEVLKYTLLDVRAKDKRGVTFIVEMQVERVSGLRKRLNISVPLPWWERVGEGEYVSQIERGEDYPKLNQVIFIGILDFEEFETPHYLTRLQILNTETYQQEITDLEFNFIELPKFTKKEAELETILEQWVYFLKYADALEVIPSNADAEPLREAYDMANQFGWSKEELDVYDYWSIKAQDERGRAEAKAQAAAQAAFIEGEQKGTYNKALETARKMLVRGYVPAEVTEITGLSVEEVAALAKEVIPS